MAAIPRLVWKVTCDGCGRSETVAFVAGDTGNSFLTVKNSAEFRMHGWTEDCGKQLCAECREPAVWPTPDRR